jgi:hypothetical protein
VVIIDEVASRNTLRNAARTLETHVPHDRRLVPAEPDASPVSMRCPRTTCDGIFLEQAVRDVPSVRRPA